MKSETMTPFLVDAKTAAKLCGVSLSLFYELKATGQAPQPVKLNSKSLWCYAQLKLWADNGCPASDSAAWQTILKGQNERI